MTVRNATKQLQLESELHSFKNTSFSMASQVARSELQESVTFVDIVSTGPIEGRSGPLHSFIEHVTTYSFPLLWAANLYVAVTWLSQLELLWTIVAALPLAWIFADFASGVMHWAADTYGTEDTPVLGKLIKPFRHHHVEPQAICTHDLVLTVGNVCILAVPLLGVLLYTMVGATEVSGMKAFIALSITLLASAGVATNIFHRWAHAERTNWFITLLQGSRLILKSDHHDLHHSAPFDSNYCIAAGWLNPLLERIDFFRRLERILSRVGLKPATSGTGGRGQGAGGRGRGRGRRQVAGAGGRWQDAGGRGRGRCRSQRRTNSAVARSSNSS